MGVTYKKVIIIGAGGQFKAKGDRKPRVYTKGAQLELTKADAERLHDKGVVKYPGEPDPPKPGAGPETEIVVDGDHSGSGTDEELAGGEDDEGAVSEFDDFDPEEIGDINALNQWATGKGLDLTGIEHDKSSREDVIEAIELAIDQKLEEAESNG